MITECFNFMSTCKGTWRRLKRALCCKRPGTGLDRPVDGDIEMQGHVRITPEGQRELRQLELTWARQRYGRIPSGAESEVEVPSTSAVSGQQLEETRVVAPQSFKGSEIGVGAPEDLVTSGVLEDRLAADGQRVVLPDRKGKGRALETEEIPGETLVVRLPRRVIVQAPPPPDEPLVEIVPPPIDEGGPDAPREGGRLRPRGAIANRATDAFWRYLVGDRHRDGRQLMGAVGMSSARYITDWFKDLFWGRAKLVAIRRVRVHQDADNDPGLEDGDSKWDYIGVVEVGGARDKLRVSLRLLARLLCFMAFRPRDTTTLPLLRSRAAQMAKEFGLSPEQLSWVIHGTVICASMANNREVVSLRALEGSRGDEVVSWSDKTSTGVLRNGGHHYWGHVSLLVVVVLVGLLGYSWQARSFGRLVAEYVLAYYLSSPWWSIYFMVLFFLLNTIPKYRTALKAA